MKNVASALLLALCLSSPTFAQDTSAQDTSAQDTSASSENPADQIAATLRRIRAGAEQGNSAAQFNLGVMYATGLGTVQDDAEAVTWYRKAAEQGNARAQYNLGIAYRDGRGVPKDDVQANAWLRKAAGQDLPQLDAQDGVHPSQ